jgi:oligoendopeptidase F
MPEAIKIPLRSEIPVSDRWNLGSLFPSPEAWERGLKDYQEMIPRIAAHRGRLGASPGALAEALAFNGEFGLLDERLAYYANLRQSEDEGDTESRGRFARYMMAATEAQGAWSWFLPELQTLPESFVASCLADPRFSDYAVFLRKVIRWKPHVLSDKEERLLALQAESAGTAQDAFSVLTNVDIDFGTVDTPEGPRPLSQSTYVSFMRHPDREIRRRAYEKFYAAYDGHKNAIAALYAGSVKLDKYRATVRNFPSARAAALFPDDVPETVYDNLVGTIEANLGALHEYYEIRKRALGLSELRHYDVYVPIVAAAKSRHSFVEATEIVCAALAPLGEEYVSTLRAGIESGWVDKYENKGKTSGAFSAGSYSGDPYILMNYKEDVIHDVFTLS